MENNTSMKIPKKYADKLEQIDVEYDEGKSYWAYSKAGYQFADMGSHTAHEDTQAELLVVIRSLEPCECKECQINK